MLNCNQCEMLCALVADGELSPEENEMLQEHLQTCAACRDYLAACNAMQDLWKQSEVLPPPNLHEHIMQGVRKEQSVVVQKPHRLPRRGFLAVAGMAACVVLVLSGSLGSMLGKNAFTAISDMSSVAMDSTTASAPTAIAEQPTAAVESRAVAAPEATADEGIMVADAGDVTASVDDSAVLYSQPAAAAEESPVAQAAEEGVLAITGETAIALPESVSEIPFASAYLVEGSPDAALPETLQLLATTEDATYYSAANDTSVLQKLVETLIGSGYDVIMTDAVAMPYDRTATLSLWIVENS